MFIEFANGSTWQLVGSDNYNSLVGSAPVGIVFSEYAVADPMAWAYLGRYWRRTKGGRSSSIRLGARTTARASTTSRGTEPGWFAESASARDKTPVFTAGQARPGARELFAEFGRAEGETLFLQEYYCSFEGRRAGPITQSSSTSAQRGPHTAVPSCRGPRSLHVVGLRHGRFHVDLVHADHRQGVPLHRLLRGAGRWAWPLREGAEGEALCLWRPLHAP